MAHAEERLGNAIERFGNDPGARVLAYKRFLKLEQSRIRLLHRSGMTTSGLFIARKRSDLFDVTLKRLYADLTANHPGGKGVTIVATGGYGRALLNPLSDIDLLYLIPEENPTAAEEAVISGVNNLIWDTGYEPGSATRSIKRTITDANKDTTLKTALIESRLVVGDQEMFAELQEQFLEKCIKGQQKEFLATRQADLIQRLNKHTTVFLQEPNVKEGRGGLRDYHNLIWLSFLEFGERDPRVLFERGVLTETEYNEIEKAYDFVHRVRNELHFISGKGKSNVLTLRLQGVVANAFGYPELSILRRCESLMHEYYQHTWNMFLHATKVLDHFQINHEVDHNPGIVGFLSRLRRSREEFDGFYSYEGRIYPLSRDVFSEDPIRMMRLFAHTQKRHLRMAPELVELARENFNLMNREFRYHRETSRIFLALLMRKGEGGRVLRQMHRVGTLGRYLPEFGALTCLVQHEFFHRYTADHHTLTCIDKFDELGMNEDPALRIIRRIYHDINDSAVMYIAFLLHDAGRAENVRFHTDSSTELASAVCRRLGIKGDRRKLILFLVDHHLTFWRTATTQNIDDPNIVEQFADSVKNKEQLDLLYVFTYADSVATSDSSWTDWKARLMAQLYHSTVLYWADKGSFRTLLDDTMDSLRPQVAKHLGEKYREEIEVHFRGMPPRYFQFRNTAIVCRHIRMIHKLRQRRTGDPVAVPLVRWRHHEVSGYSTMTVCVWNRPSILTTITGVLAANSINILSADINTRNDGIVLDIFRLCTTFFTPVDNENKRKRLEAHLAKAIIESKSDFSKEIEAAADSDPISGEEIEVFPQRVIISNEAHPDTTTVEIQAIDRLGLLHHLYRLIDRMGIEVMHSRIATEKGAALDTLSLTTRSGKQITDPIVLAVLQDSIEEVIRIKRHRQPDAMYEV